VRARRQAAGAGEAGPQFHPGQSCHAAARAEDRARAFGALHPRRWRRSTSNGGGPGGRAVPRRDPGAQRRRELARAAYAPPPLQAVVARLRVPGPGELPRASCCARSRAPDKASIVDARVFDLFVGQGVPEGRKSLAIEVTLQPARRASPTRISRAIAERIVGARGEAGSRTEGMSDLVAIGS
jgi:phenylalanyl-tRNA synthetase beta chain